MDGFIVAHMTARDPEKLAQYRGAVGATLEPFGGKVALTGRVEEVPHGTHAHTGVVILTFPDSESARAWYDSEAYQALIPLRDAAMESVFIRFGTPR